MIVLWWIAVREGVVVDPAAVDTVVTKVVAVAVVAAAAAAAKVSVGRRQVVPPLLTHASSTLQFHYSAMIPMVTWIPATNTSVRLSQAMIGQLVGRLV